MDSVSILVLGRKHTGGEKKGDFLTKSCQMASVLCTGLMGSCERIRLCGWVNDTARYSAASMTRGKHLNPNYSPKGILLIHPGTICFGSV